MKSDEIVDALRPFGLVQAHHLKSGWYAVCELFLVGVQAKTDSGFGHPTMNSALIALHAATMGVVSNMQRLSAQLPAPTERSHG